MGMDTYCKKVRVSSIAMAALAFAFVGSGMALFFSPQSGAVLRKIMKRYASIGIDDMLNGNRAALQKVLVHGQESVGSDAQLERLIEYERWLVR
jgi:hypothetical protein